MIDHGYRVYAWTHLLRLVFLVPALLLCALGALAPDVPMGFRLLMPAIYGVYVWWAVVSHRYRTARRDYLAKYAIGRGAYGSLVIDEVPDDGPKAPQLIDIVDQGIGQAWAAWPLATPVDWSRWNVLFKPGLPAGPHTKVGHFVYSGVWVRQDDVIQVQCDPGDATDVLVARVRWGCLQLLDAKHGHHGTEEDHRRHIRAMGIETP